MKYNKNIATTNLTSSSIIFQWLQYYNRWYYDSNIIIMLYIKCNRFL